MLFLLALGSGFSSPLFCHLPNKFCTQIRLLFTTTTTTPTSHSLIQSKFAPCTFILTRRHLYPNSQQINPPTASHSFLALLSAILTRSPCRITTATATPAAATCPSTRGGGDTPTRPAAMFAVANATAAAVATMSRRTAIAITTLSTGLIRAATVSAFCPSIGGDC